MLICTFAVSVLINKQNREASNELLRKSFTLIDELISNRQKKLMIDSRQIASMNVKNVMDIVNTGKSALYSMLKPVYVKTAEGIYNIAVNADMQKAAMYDINGDLIAFSIREIKGSSFPSRYSR